MLSFPRLSVEEVRHDNSISEFREAITNLVDIVGGWSESVDIKHYGIMWKLCLLYNNFFKECGNFCEVQVPAIRALEALEGPVS